MPFFVLVWSVMAGLVLVSALYIVDARRYDLPKASPPYSTQSLATPPAPAPEVTSKPVPAPESPSAPLASPAPAVTPKYATAPESQSAPLANVEPQQLKQVLRRCLGKDVSPTTGNRRAITRGHDTEII